MAAIAEPSAVANVGYTPRLYELLIDQRYRGRIIQLARTQEHRLRTSCLVFIAENVWHGTHQTSPGALAAKDLVAERLDHLSDPRQRIILARDALRLLAEQSFRAIVAAPNFATHLVLSALPAAIGDRADGGAVQQALGRADDGVIAARTAAFLVAMRLVGLRPRHPGSSLEDFTLTITATLWGFAHRYVLHPQRVDRFLERADGQCHLVAGNIEGTISEWFEPDPTYDSAPALQKYLTTGLAARRAPSQIVQIPGPEA